MHIFFTPELELNLQHFILSEEESKHAIRVLRLQVRDKIQLVNGRGDLFTGEISDPHPKRTVILITDSVSSYQSPNYHLHMLVAPTKNIDRYEWFLEKATEIGVQEITPIVCEHSERKDLKLERLNKVVVAAMKQSLKAYLPKLNPPISFREFIKKGTSADVQKGIAHCELGEKAYLNHAFSPGGHYMVLIGPEGDFSPEEISMAEAEGFLPITLGQYRMRTETAAVAAVLELSILNR